MKISLLKLRNESKEYFDAHEQVKSFFWGDFIRVYSENQIKHSAVIIDTLRATQLGRKSVQLQLIVTYASRVFSDFSNLDEVHSDAVDVLSDFIDTLNYAPRWKDFVTGASNGNAEFFTNRTGDLVAGAAMIITVTIKNTVDLCAQPVGDYDFDLSPQLPPSDCLPVQLTNSDGEWELILPSGAFYEVPDTPVTVVDQNQNVLAQEDLPSVTGGAVEVFVEPCPPCEPVTYEILRDGEPFESGQVESGGSLVVDVPSVPCEPCEDATYVLTIGGNAVDSGTIGSGQTEEIPIDAFIPECEDATFQINGDVVGTAASGGMLNIAVTQGGDPVGSFNETTQEWEVPPCPTPPPCPNVGGLYKSGLTTSLITNDEGATQQGDNPSFLRLDFINCFGNDYLLTGVTGGYQDELGDYYNADGTPAASRAAAFPDEIIINHSTWKPNALTVWGVANDGILGSPTSYANLATGFTTIINPATSYGGFTGDWLPANMKFYFDCPLKMEDTNKFNYPPFNGFNILTAGTITRWTGTRMGTGMCRVVPNASTDIPFSRQTTGNAFIACMRKFTYNPNTNTLS